MGRKGTDEATEEKMSPRCWMGLETLVLLVAELKEASSGERHTVEIGEDRSLEV